MPMQKFSKPDHSEESKIGEDAINFLLDKEYKLKDLKSRISYERKKEINKVHRRYKSRLDSIQRDIDGIINAAKSMISLKKYWQMKKYYLAAERERIAAKKKLEPKNEPQEKPVEKFINKEPPTTTTNINSIGGKNEEGKKRDEIKVP